jgi:hypothetical protein
MERLHYPVGTRVRLRWSLGALTAGSEGVVVGYYRADPPTYAVDMAEKSLQIPPEYLVAVDADEERVT